MTPFLPGSVTSDGNENCHCNVIPNPAEFRPAYDLHRSRGPNSAQWSPLGLTQPRFGAEMFPPNQRSKPIFRKTAEHYVVYNALHAIMILQLQHIQAKMKICVISEQTAAII